MRHDHLEGFFPLEDDALTLAVARANLELFRASDAYGAPDEEDDDVEPRNIIVVEPRDTPPNGRGLPTQRGGRGSAPHDPHLEACRRTVRERVYRYLAVLSRTPHACGGQPFELLEVLPRALVNLLGIKDDRERPDEQMLPLRLTVNFRDWLAEQDGQHFVVDWGDMRLHEHKLLMLRARALEHREPRRAQTLTGFPAPRTRPFRNR